MKIGVLHIQSSLYPLATYDFAEGLEMAFEQHAPDMPITIVAEEGQISGSTNSIQEKCLKLFSQHKCKAIATLAENRPNIELFNNLSQMTSKYILFSGWGGILGLQQNSTNPYVYYNNLELCQSTFLTAKYMAKNYEKILVLTTYYEGGYQFMYSFYEGLFTQRENPPQVYGIENFSKDGVLEAFAEYYRNNPADAIYVMLSYKDAEIFADFWAKNIREKAVLFTHYPFVQRIFLQKERAILSEFYYTSSFHLNTQTAEMADFTQKCAAREVEPTEYTLLGYENGQLLARILKGENQQTIHIQSIRQDWNLAENTKRTSSTHILYKSTLANGQYTHEVVEAFPQDNGFEDVIQGAEGKQFSEWLNPYLSV